MASPLPPGYTTRPVTLDDRAAIVELLAASDRALIGEVDYAEEDLADEWGRPRFDLARDPVLVETEGGGLAGYAYVWESEPGRVVASWAAPHPEHAFLYAYLLDRIEARARGILREGGTLRVAVYETETLGRALLTERGFSPVRYFWRMAIALAGREIEPPPPGGIGIRPFAPGADDRAVHAALEESFAEHWGTPTEPYEEWRRSTLEGDHYDPTLWLVAEEAGQVVGVLLARRTGERGWIAELGVRPAWRGRGAGLALLRYSFAEFARRGVPEVILSVDSENATGATRLYERAGMRPRFRFDFYEKLLDG